MIILPISIFTCFILSEGIRLNSILRSFDLLVAHILIPGLLLSLTDGPHHYSLNDWLLKSIESFVGYCDSISIRTNYCFFSKQENVSMKLPIHSNSHKETPRNVTHSNILPRRRAYDLIYYTRIAASNHKYGILPYKTISIYVSIIQMWIKSQN